MNKIKYALSRQQFLLLASSTAISSVCLGQLANAQAHNDEKKPREVGRLESIVRRLFASGEAKDADTFITFFTEDARYTVGNNPAVIGPAAIRESVSKYAFPVVQSFYHNIKDTWERKNSLVIQFQLEVINLEGQPIGPFPIVDVFRFQGDQIAEMQIYGDLREIYPESPNT